MNKEIVDILIEKILSNQANSSDKEEFNNWINASNANKTYYEQNKVIRKKLNSTYSDVKFDQNQAKKEIVHKVVQIKQKRTRSRLKMYIGVAASITLLIGLFAILNSTQTLITYQTAQNIEHYTLPDNTEVWLNKNSSIKINKSFNKRDRKITLSGEAFFEVEPDLNKPFKIIVANTQTKVLGTSFNICESPKEVVVSVTTGNVNFKNKWSLHDGVNLLKNEASVYKTETNEFTKYTNSNTNYLSWKTGIITFYDTPINEVCNVLNKHYGSKIQITNNIQHLALTGTFNNETLSKILETIEFTLDVKVYKTKTNTLLIKPLE